MNTYLPDNNSILDSFYTFSDVEYIVSDIDGTLTLGSIPIIQQIKKKTVKLKKKNVLTTIATGRPYCGAYNVIQELGIATGTPLVLYNGGILIEHNTGRIIKEYSIPYEETQKIVEIVSGCGAGIYVYTCDVFIPDVFNILDGYKLRENVYYAGKIKRKIDVNGKSVLELANDSIKEKKIVSILIERSEISKDVFEQVMNYLEGDSEISYTDSGNGFIEIRALQDRKSIIIDELRKMNIQKGNKTGKILAIGDNDNDIDLFKVADISVAVANSSPKAIKTADYLCKRDNAEGYLDMLVVVETAKRYCR